MRNSVWRRPAGVSALLLASFGLAACNNNSVTAAPPSVSETSQTSSSASDTESSANQSPASSSAEASQTSSGSVEETSKYAKLKFGDPAVIVDDDDTYRLTVKDLKVAPESVYQDSSLDKVNGTVYFIDFDVTNLKQGSSYFGTNSINGLFLHPTFQQGVKAKRMYGDLPGCESDSKELAEGETGSNCYIYQIDGPKLSGVTFNDYEHNITWTE